MPFLEQSEGFVPSAHGGRRSAGHYWRQARNIHSQLSEPLHPDLEGVGIFVDIPDLADRIQYGNQFDAGTARILIGPEVYSNDQTVGLSLFQSSVAASENIGGATSIGEIQAGFDGIGVNANAKGLSTNLALGPVDIGGTIGKAEAGAKLWQPDVGLDAGIKANASIVEGHVGPVNIDIGIGVDTGVKAGKEGFGAKVIGTGFQLGRICEISLFGSSVGFQLW